MYRLTSSRVSSALPLVLLVAGLMSCSEPTTIDTSEQLASDIRRQQLDGFVHTFALELPARALRAAEQSAVAPTLSTNFEQNLAFETDSLIVGLVAEIYQERAYTPVFVGGTGLNPAGEALALTLSAASEHGLVASDYYVEEVAALRERLQRSTGFDDFRLRFALTPEDEQTLMDWVSQHAAADETLPATAAIFDLVLRSEVSQSPLPRITQAIIDLRQLIEDVSAAAPELEVRLMSGALRYARDIKYAHTDPLIPSEAAGAGWDLETEAGRAAAVRTRLATGIREGLHEDFGAWLASLPPANEQYPRLLEGSLEYAGYVAAGGWQPLTVPIDMGSGASAEHVLALRQRLAAENYLAEDAVQIPAWDSQLSSAVEHYQTTHQLSITGTVSEETLNSLNVSAVRRLAQIHTTMERWRNARSLRHVHGEYIAVSLPDFHAELWDQDERVYRWRVIIGRTRNVRTRGGGTEVQGLTPLFSDTMLYVVFNPYWNVPRDIRNDEYQPLIDADPNWLFDNGFEMVTNADGSDFLRQLPGPANALGVVKFLFPNEHDVYMHDTPTRNLFSRTIRAFSHGCVRVHEPLQLAHVLLQRDRDWSDSQTEAYIEDQLESGEEKWVSLTRPIPIHIEYYSVRGDDDGRMNFLADIYRHDRARVDELEARLLAQLPGAAAAAEGAAPDEAEVEVVVPAGAGGF